MTEQLLVFSFLKVEESKSDLLGRWSSLLERRRVGLVFGRGCSLLMQAIAAVRKTLWMLFSEVNAEHSRYASAPSCLAMAEPCIKERWRVLFITSFNTFLFNGLPVSPVCVCSPVQSCVCSLWIYGLSSIFVQLFTFLLDFGSLLDHSNTHGIIDSSKWQQMNHYTCCFFVTMQKILLANIFIVNKFSSN